MTAQHNSEVVIIGKRSEIGQLLLALLTNGVEACAAVAKKPEKPGDDPEKPLVCVTVMREQSKILVRVEDSGPGIPPDIRPRIFEPFFTTKKDALGLGLTFARQVASSHGGSVELDRSELGGALVRVVVPAAPAGTALPARSAGPASRRKPLLASQPPVTPDVTGEMLPNTAREGWTSAPKVIAGGNARRPVKAPIAAPSPLIVAPDTDVCAPTQRVPQTPPTGMPAVTPASDALTPIRRRATPAPPTVNILIASRAAPDSSTSGAPTARVPEAPRRAPRSKRMK